MNITPRLAIVSLAVIWLSGVPTAAQTRVQEPAGRPSLKGTPRVEVGRPRQAPRVTTTVQLRVSGEPAPCDQGAGCVTYIQPTLVIRPTVDFRAADLRDPTRTEWDERLCLYEEFRAYLTNASCFRDSKVRRLYPISANDDGWAPFVPVTVPYLDPSTRRDYVIVWTISTTDLGQSYPLWLSR